MKARDIERDCCGWIVPGSCQGQMVEVAYGDDRAGTVFRRVTDRSDRSVAYSYADAADCGCEAECNCWEPWNREPSGYDWIHVHEWRYSIFDADPQSSTGTVWTDHDNVELDAESDEDAIDQVRELLQDEASGLNISDGYCVGDQIHALVWRDGETIIAQPKYTLTLDDLSVDKDCVERWETVDSYVATYDDDNDIGEGACDVDVQIGEAGGVWFIRTRDDGGGSDEATDEGFATEDEAREAVTQFVEEQREKVEAEANEDAETYLRRRREELAGDPSSDGEWCVYWSTSLDDEGPRERYDTREQAEAACTIANDDLHARHPGSLLCCFEVRQLVDGEWVQERGQG